MATNTSPETLAPQVFNTQSQSGVSSGSAIGSNMFSTFASFPSFDLFDGFGDLGGNDIPPSNWQQTTQAQGNDINPDILEFLGIGLQTTDVPYNLYNPSFNA
jgi:hypothetical protein